MKGEGVIRGLIRQRRELGRAIAEHQAAIERLRLDMAAVDHVLLLWRPEMDLEAIAPLRSDHRGVKPGHLARVILAALRHASEPLGVTDIARVVMAAERRCGEPIAKHRERVRQSLDQLKARGLVVAERDGGRLVWGLAG